MKEKASDLTKALCLRILAKSFLTAYALCTAFHAPLAPGQIGRASCRERV